jgi:hypothetical protein
MIRACDVHVGTHNNKLERVKKIRELRESENQLLAAACFGFGFRNRNFERSRQNFRTSFYSKTDLPLQTTSEVSKKQPQSATKNQHNFDH